MANLRGDWGKSASQSPAQLPPPNNNNWQRALFLPLTILAWLAVGIVVLWLLGHITHALVVIVLAVIVSFALAPLVALLRKQVIRPVAVLGAYLVGVTILIGLGTLLVSTAAGQVVNLVSNLPADAARVKQLGPQALAFLRPLGVTDANLQSFNQQILTGLQGIGAALAASSLSIVSRFASRVLDAILVLILSIYFTLDGTRLVTWAREKTPMPFRSYVRYFLEVINQVVGGYVRGTLLMALLIGGLVGIGLGIIGVPYAVLLGVLAFFMEFVPVIGVLISGAISILVSIPHGLGFSLIVLAYFIIVHVIEGDVVGPRIMGKAVGIHPATGIIALLIGTELFGVWGALFGAPLAGLIQAFIIGIYRVRRSDPEALEDIPVVLSATAADSPPSEEK